MNGCTRKVRLVAAGVSILLGSFIASPAWARGGDLDKHDHDGRRSREVRSCDVDDRGESRHERRRHRKKHRRIAHRQRGSHRAHHDNHGHRRQSRHRRPTFGFHLSNDGDGHRAGVTIRYDRHHRRGHSGKYRVWVSGHYDRKVEWICDSRNTYRKRFVRVWVPGHWKWHY